MSSQGRGQATTTTPSTQTTTKPPPLKLNEPASDLPSARKILPKLGSNARDEVPHNISGSDIDARDLFENISDDSDLDSPRSTHSFSELYTQNNDIVDVLKPEDVRWFYKYDNDKKWTHFIGFDSLRMECSYRQYLGISQSALPESCAAIDSKLRMVDKLTVRGGLFEVDFENMTCRSVYWTGEQFQITRGLWFYEGNWQPVNILLAEVIEKAHLGRFMGTKVSDFVCDVAGKGAKPVIHRIQLPDFHVEWNSPTEVHLFSEATSSKFFRTVSQRFGLIRSGHRLHRGYCEEASAADKPRDITHLVFVIHGIGQKMEQNKVIRNCSKLRDTTNKLKRKYFAKLLSSSERSEFFPVEWRSGLVLDGGTVENITPHRIRNLRELLNRTAMDILYYTSPLYRTEIVTGLLQELNRLYTIFCQQNPAFEPTGGKVSIVAHSLGCVIAYDIITAWNPIQLYLKDLMSDLQVSKAASRKQSNDNWKTVLALQKSLMASKTKKNSLKFTSESDQSSTKLASRGKQLDDSRKTVLELEKKLKSSTTKKNALKFTIENFFCLGSPLAVFLALRGFCDKNYKSQDDIIPRNLVKRIFNIYHPTDPVAYRLEPLILQHYKSIMPILIHHYSAAEKVPYEIMKPEKLIPQEKMKQHDIVTTEILDEPPLSPQKISKESRWSTMFSGWRKKKIGSSIEELQEFEGDEEGRKMEDSNVAEVVTELHNPSLPVDSEKVDPEGSLEYRLDYTIREGNLESVYFSIFTAHSCYWGSNDVAFFILNYLHPGADSITVKNIRKKEEVSGKLMPKSGEIETPWTPHV